MQFTVSQNQIFKAISLIQGIVEKKRTLPILSNVLLQTNDNKLQISATDLEIGIKIECSAEIEKNGKITVPAKKIFEIIKEISSPEINIKTNNDSWIEIISGNATFKVIALSADEYPTIINKQPENTIKIECKEFKRILDKTINSISTDEKKYNLNGIYIHSDDNYIYFVSTDGHRLSYIRSENSNIKINNLENGIIIPRKGIIELKKIIEENIDEILDIGFVDNNIIITIDNIFLTIRLIDGSFPDYHRVIPKNTENYTIVNTSLLHSAIRRISILANEKSRGISFKITDSSIEISSSNPEFGEATEKLPATYNGDELTIGFNSKYLLDVLSNIESENIKLFINNNKSPCLIMEENSEDFKSIIMPMNI